MYRQLTLRLAFSCNQAAQQMARRMLNCPHVVGLAAVDAGAVRLTFLVPTPKLGWALALAGAPGLIGAVSAAVEEMTAVAAPSGESTPLAQTVPPGGSNCTGCPHYLVRCGGCPATPLFRPGYVFV